MKTKISILLLLISLCLSLMSCVSGTAGGTERDSDDTVLQSESETEVQNETEAEHGVKAFDHVDVGSVKSIKIYDVRTWENVYVTDAEAMADIVDLINDVSETE